MTTSKQKHKLLPLVIYNPLIPVKGFLAMVTIFILWIRSEYKGDTRRLNERFFRHETIHVYQQTEIWITSIISYSFTSIVNICNMLDYRDNFTSI